MIFDDMRRELKELLDLVRRDEQYSAAVMSGKVVPSAEAQAEHARRATRIADITDRYGIR